MLVLKDVFYTHYVKEGFVQLAIADVGLVGLAFWLDGGKT